MLSDRFMEFDYDKAGFVKSWLVFGKDKHIVINPAVAFGSPQVNGIPTRIIKDRWISGEDVEDITLDFGLVADLVREALEFEGIDPSSRASH